jgi:hypothetical protein
MHLQISSLKRGDIPVASNRLQHFTYSPLDDLIARIYSKSASEIPSFVTSWEYEFTAFCLQLVITQKCQGARHQRSIAEY